MRTAFDAYLMVDWSGSDKPTRPGKDSIWWSLHAWSGRRLARVGLSNPRTRTQAARELREQLIALGRQSRSVLVGFDFAFGFPAGTAARLHPGGVERAPWRRAWDALAANIHDADDNRSNRFEVAARFNALLTQGASPFWGWDVSRGPPPSGLRATKPSEMPEGIEALRFVDRRIRGPKSVFQLWGAGSVGSQALLGVPRVDSLLRDPALRDHSAVWPVTTGAKLSARGAGPRIVYAEIYPSFIAVEMKDGECKDEAQVQSIARHFAAEDAAGRLVSLFEAARAGPPSALDEEGWILGVR